MDPEGDGEAQGLTRRFGTTHGELTYAELADAIAPHLERLLDRIADGEFAARPFSEALAQEFHVEIIGSILPDIAGRWRRESVRVGMHVPPEHFLVPMRMRQYADNVRTRLEFATSLDLQIELLAYAEGEFLHVHPFTDFNGRTIRALLSELLVRLDFPPVEVSVERGTDRFREYGTALAHYDNGRLDALIDFWFRRLEEGS
ncbi:Fic family protein [Jiangella alkaliphila]|uniref:Fic/DOC family protein n=1 Tax=Jiangella alkaliphila TaxID=419479 RepID=A0A1H2LVF2_9ACTN|nr:Fic family protein [Jiangella alkaliphila]SDU84967.1 Fic/DOC family protein [Jiangella alkaliphila]